MATPKKPRQLIEFALIFAAIYLLSTFALRTFFPDKFGNTPKTPTMTLSAEDASLTIGHHPILVLKNTTTEKFVIENRCPQPPVQIFYASSGDPDLTGKPLVASGTVLPCVAISPVIAGGQTQIDLGPWKYALFEKTGTYVARIDVPESHAADVITVEARFSIGEPGVITQMFRTFITKPFLNFLIFIASILPDHNLGIAIIVLTLIVKLLLFFPTQHAMKGQKEMQKLQPKIDELKRRYKDDSKLLQAETMKLWKEHKVNPFQSCLPMLVQFPILIGLFYTVRDGSVLALSRHLIYPPFQNLPWAFNTHFFMFDLLKPSVYVFPALLFILQFAQMKLSFAMSARKKAATEEKSGKKSEPASQQQMQQRVMLYGLPVMIAFFALRFPTAVSLYWGVSTLFAIGQQIVVNRSKD